MGGVLALGAAVLALSAAASPARERASERPNIVVITTDDQTVESLRVMANVNRLLAAQGVVFESSFASFPLCCPSRATLLTGQYSHNHGVVGNSARNGLSRLDQTNTLPVWLQRAGYATAFVGKYLNAYGKTQRRTIPPGWNEWYAGLTLAYFRHSMNRNGKLVRYGDGPASYQTDVYARTAVDVVRRRAADAKPFFLWLSFFAPHAGGPREAHDPVGIATPVPAPRHRDLLRAERLPPSPAFDEVDVDDKPLTIRRRARLTADDQVAVRAKYQQRLESLLAVDEAVASVVAALRATGELGRTLIVFTSDNGFFHGEHRIRDGKELLYEPSVRVPLIFRGPGVPRGRRLDQPVANVDLAPTIAEFARATPGRIPDGRSLVPLFADATVEWGRDLLFERGPGPSGVGDRLVTALRTPRFLYAEHANGERELYDLDVDPNQLRSVHLEPAYDVFEAELARRLATLRNCAGADCFRGPALSLAVVAARGCATTVRVSGLDEPFVRYVDFLADRRALARDEQAPFEQRLISGRAVGRLRAVATLVDGRRVTLETTARSCP